MTFYYSRTTSSVYLLLGSRRYRFFYQPISIEATYYAWPTLKKAPTRVPTRHWFPGDYGTSQSSYVFSLLGGVRHPRPVRESSCPTWSFLPVAWFLSDWCFPFPLFRSGGLEIQYPVSLDSQVAETISVEVSRPQRARDKASEARFCFCV